ncbi:Signal Recognition Particle (SRP) component with 4.5S RNA (ffs) [Wigglesworthia glossinidia endosymbiont of Glossina morsitans morsitans (Yale colony)]|uniref:signal-recognition-particle GTPase n=1 Tax=Wigglesworthia glossinidia endosymbiont of Glossina morsitans morsitans (Yale colony) TaxID=1142511 RepID=H6Q569_WIGGL|nr:signal recognition particle receptor subunit alpha [Wigglesworthia glossinidia]AFA41352.1 Signal Recognition Particle (SRP) component with 4.5S RNA (ffs) [Wigglesworthia glossinidia endosymbiont of Glossina morsitans morsitans (Yale colony)]
MIFSNLSNKLHNILKNISERGRLTSENIGNTLRQVRIALLEADVALPVIEKFIQEIKNIALNKEINKNLTPGQEFIKIVHNELINIIGSTQSELIYSKNSPTIIFLVGPQGSGKTTTIGKLGKYLKNKHAKNVLTISIDFHRPAALKQLEYLAKKAGIDFFNVQELNNNAEILIQSAIQKAKLKHDIVLIDTAGIMHTNLKMIQKIQQLQNIFRPSETLYVIDSMMGQDAINNIKTFSNTLSLTGIILTKLDGDARGGVALSARYITKKPIKFIGTGEHVDQLEIFSPKILAQKILGMHDIFSLIKQVEHQVSKIKKQKKTFLDKKNKTFNLNDFLSHLSQIKKIGGIKTVMHQLSKTSQYADCANENINDKLFTKMEAIIKSMTIQERNNPSIIKSSRKKRIAFGSGTKVQDINILLKRFYDTEKIMKQIKNKGLIKTMQKIKNLIPFRPRKN